MYIFKPASRFKKQYRKLNNDDKARAKALIDKLLNDEPLDKSTKIGQYEGFRECHIKPDLLLIYKKEEDILILTCLAIGSHSELF